MSFQCEVLPDRTEARPEALRALWVAKASHAPLALPRGLVAVLGTVVDTGRSLDEDVLHVGRSFGTNAVTRTAGTNGCAPRFAVCSSAATHMRHAALSARPEAAAQRAPVAEPDRVLPPVTLGVAQVGGKKELTGRTNIEIGISNQCARLIANAIVYYNSAILSRLLEKCRASGNDKALALITSMSPVAWRHIHLNGHYTFRGNGQAIDLDAIIRGLNLE